MTSKAEKMAEIQGQELMGRGGRGEERGDGQGMMTQSQVLGTGLSSIILVL